MPEKIKRTIYFVQDGLPTLGYGCGFEACSKPPVANFLILDDETNERVTSVDLCEEHAKKFSTGYC